MIDESFLNKVSKMSADVKELEIHGVPHTSKRVYEVERPMANDILSHSLSSVSVMFNEQSSETVAPFAHVVDHGTVNVLSGLDSIDRKREWYLHATLVNNPFKFDTFLSAEMFIIALQAQFVQDAAIAAILRVVGNITEEAEHKILDDGVTQTVTAKAGIAKIENVSIPNPVTLRPYRTFQEIEQPASKFVFRMKKSKDGDGPTCALFEADGGAWKNDAIASIKKYLEFELPQGTVIIA